MVRVRMETEMRRDVIGAVNPDSGLESQVKTLGD